MFGQVEKARGCEDARAKSEVMVMVRFCRSALAFAVCLDPQVQKFIKSPKEDGRGAKDEDGDVAAHL